MTTARHCTPMFETTFGLLTQPLTLDSGGVVIAPVADFAELVVEFKAALHQDGFYYPGEEERVSLPDFPDETRQVPVPNTRRPAHLFTLPPSHTLRIESPASTDPLRDDASFLVQLLAYLYGTRLQVDGWQFDGRIPVGWPTHAAHVLPAAAARFVARAYQEWRAQPPERRLRITNVLYMHAKAPSYDWPWERFLIEYLVNDALYDVCSRSGLAVRVGHEARIRELCGRLGVWCPPEAPVEALVEARNTLFHEALWENERPGYRISAEGRDRVQELRALNQRLIAAALGGMTEYTAIPWTMWHQMVFFA